MTYEASPQETDCTRDAGGRVHPHDDNRWTRLLHTPGVLAPCQPAHPDLIYKMTLVVTGLRGDQATITTAGTP
jgi:hypothetical protein